MKEQEWWSGQHGIVEEQEVKFLGEPIEGELKALRVEELGD